MPNKSFGQEQLTAINVTDASFSNDYTYLDEFKEQWFKFKVITREDKYIITNLLDNNPIKIIKEIAVYKMSFGSLVRIGSETATNLFQKKLSIKLDPDRFAIDDSLFIQIIHAENNSCMDCNNNFNMSYNLQILPPPDCGFTNIFLTNDGYFDSESCQVYPPSTAGAPCTLKVCSGQELCIRLTVNENYHAFHACGAPTATLDPALFSDIEISQEFDPDFHIYIRNYCITAGTTPGIYPVSVCWAYLPDNEECDEGLPDDRFYKCCGIAYIEIGPSRPPAMAYTATPNPVCRGENVCFNVNNPNLPSYTYQFDDGNGAVSGPGSSATGINICHPYNFAGTFVSSLIVHNGYCASPSSQLPIIVNTPSINSTIVQNNCRNYTLTANPVCITGNINYTWNIGGQIFTGNSVTVDLPGNSSTVSYALTATGSNGSFSTSGNIINVPTASLSFIAQHTGCKNITYTATANCVPPNYIIKWTIGGVIHYGNPIVVSEGSLSNVHLVNPVITVLDYSGNALFTQTYTPYNIAVTAGTPVCCIPNTDCVRTAGGGSGRTESTCEAISWSTSQTLSGNPPPYTNKAFTVAPNVTITISANAKIKFTDCTFQMGQGSKIVINKNANSLILENCYLHGCQQLWDGIRTENSTASSSYKALIKIDNSLIEDAVVALDASALNFYSRIFINNTVFNKNITGIKYINKPKNESTGVQNAISVTNSVFTCKEYDFAVYASFQNGLTMYNNYLVNTADAIPLTKSGLSYHQKSLIGISIEGVFYNTAADNVLQYVPLADTISVTENLIYNNLVQGIASKGLNLKAFKGNNFKNISSPLAGGNFPTYNATNTASIYLTGRGYSLTTGNTLLYTTNKIGTTNYSVSQRNKFTNCYYGVYAKDEPIDVTQNDFTDCYNGIFITNSRVPSTVSNTPVNCSVKGNKIIRVKQTGIALVNNVTINAEVTTNVINNVTGTNYTSRAADISETQAFTTANYKVLDNTFTKVWNGTRFTNIYKPIVTNNNINLNTSPTFTNSTNNALYNTGIHIVSCTEPQVNENVIYEANNANTWWEQGIVVSSSANGKYYCNDVNGTFSSITTGSTCSGTKIYNNDFSNAKYAHWLIFSNVIGDQYNPAASVFPNKQPADNRYYNVAPWHSFVQNGTNGFLNARFYIRGNNSTPPYQLLNNTFIDVSTQVNFLPLPNSEYPFSAAGCAVIVDPCAGSPSTCRLMGQAKEIAKDIIYPLIDKRDRFVSRKQLLDNLQKESIGLTGDADIDNFPDSMDNIAIGKFHRVDVLAQQGIDSGDSTYLVQAENINQSVNPTDVVEEKQKQVNEAYLYHLKHGGELSPEKVDMLKTIAPLCPYTHGSSIWQARAMLKAIENVEYFNECELYSALDEELISAARVLPKEEIIEAKQYFSLYPNPNDGNFKLALNNTEYSAYDIEILNSFGSLVSKYNVNTNENKEALIVTELSQGIYFVVIRANGIVLETKKVIVTK